MNLDFDQVYEAYAERVYAFIQSMLRDAADADDCFQQTWIAIHKGLPRYQERGQRDAWIFRIARNAVYDWYRQRQNIQQFEYTEAEESGLEDDPVQQLDVVELHEHIQEAVQKLSPKLRAVFLLRVQQELSFNDIAEILEEPRNRLLARMHMATKIISQAIQSFRKDV